MHNPLALFAVSISLAAPSFAQGTWPDDPWTDYRSLDTAEMNAVGRAVAFLGAGMLATGREPGTNHGMIGWFTVGEGGIELREIIGDPSGDPTPGFGMRMEVGNALVAVADTGHYFDIHQAYGGNEPLPPEGPGRVELFTYTGFNQQLTHTQTLENPTGDQRSGFGMSLAIEGSVVVVGAPFATVFGVENAGAVFVYERRFGNEYRRVATLTPSTLVQNGYFGWAVENTGRTIFVGWPGSDANQGRVVMYEDSHSDDWEQTRIFSREDLSLPDTTYTGWFGAAIASRPDFNPNILAISAPTTFVEGIGRRGMVFVFEADPPVGVPFGLTQTISPQSIHASGRFGESLDFNSDFVDRTLAIGSGNRSTPGRRMDLYSNRLGEPDWNLEATLPSGNGGSIALLSGFTVERALASGNDGRAYLYAREAFCFRDLRADANGDGVVDFQDLNIVLSQFGQTGENLDGDLSGDGVVDFLDLNIVNALFGAPCVPPR